MLGLTQISVQLSGGVRVADAMKIDGVQAFAKNTFFIKFGLCLFYRLVESF